MLILDFSGAYEEEGWLSFLKEERWDFTRVDLRDMTGACRYCDEDAEVEIRRRIRGKEAQLRWIDSGDYHYMTKILSDGEKIPFTLVLVDNHPDDQEPAFGSILSCGGWVGAIKNSNPLLEAVWTLGPEGRIRSDEGKTDRPLGGDIDDLLRAVEGKRIYLSLDKDVLSRRHARTGWSQGAYSLEDLKRWLVPLLERHPVAVDICGEWQASQGATPEDLRINFETNVDLLLFIADHLNN